MLSGKMGAWSEDYGALRGVAKKQQPTGANFPDRQPIL